MTETKGQLAHLAGAYFHQDYDLEWSDADEGIAAFVADLSPDESTATVAELDELLASAMTERDLDTWWISTLHSSYEPAKDGMTYREWFAHVRDLLVRSLEG